MNEMCQIGAVLSQKKSVVPESSETDGGAVRFGGAYWPPRQLKQEDTRCAQSTQTTPHSIRMISLKSN